MALPEIPDDLRYEQEPPAHDALIARSREVGDRHRAAYERVYTTAGEQRAVAEELRTELVALQADSAALAPHQRKGVFGGLLERFGGRGSSPSAGMHDALLRRYDAATVHLRAASAYADELEQCAHELQQDLDRLHAEGQAAGRDADRARRRSALLDAAHDAHPERDARGRDELAYAGRRARSEVARFRQAERLCHEAVDPTRRLRDAALDLHDDIGRFVLSASHTLQSASRHVHALGLAAEAPAVIADLHDAMSDLDAALQATEAYVARAQAVLKVELPRLLDHLRDEVASRGHLLITSDGTDHAERALREDAADEVRGVPPPRDAP